MTSIKKYLTNQAKDKSNPLRFYVYAYIRSKDSSTAKAGTPYYIGKGCGRRAWCKHDYLQIPEDNYIIILEKNLTEIGAYSIERNLIKIWGRKKYTDFGILYNMSVGGPSGKPPKIKPKNKLYKNIRKEKLAKEKLVKNLIKQLNQKILKIKSDNDLRNKKELKLKLIKLNQQIKEIKQPLLKIKTLEKMSLAKLGKSYEDRLGVNESKITKNKQSTIHKIIQNNRPKVCHIETRKEYDINTFTTKFLRTDEEINKTLSKRKANGILGQSNRIRVCDIETRKEYDLNSFKRWVLNEGKNNRVCDIITHKEYHVNAFTKLTNLIT